MSYSKPTNKNPSNSDWLIIVNSAIAKVEKPVGLTCDDWRVPTLAEAKVFVQDPSVVTPIQSYSYYCCLIGEKLGWLRYSLSEAGELVLESNSSFGSVTPLRPVIDITY